VSTSAATDSVQTQRTPHPAPSTGPLTPQIFLQPRWLFARLQRNMGLRIISLMVAIGLWLFVNAGERGTVAAFAVPINYHGLPPGYVITNQHPDFVQIQVSGTRSLLSLIDPARLTLRIELGGVSIGEATYNIGPENFAMPRGTEVQSVSPSQIGLQIDRMVRRDVPVHVMTTGKPQEGYQVSAIEVTPKSVTLTGPGNELARIEAVNTVPFDLAGLAADATRPTPIVLPSDAVERIEPDSVTATVAVRPAITNKEFRGVPVAVRDSQYPVRMTPSRLTVTLRGPAPTLATLDLRGAAYVEADGIAPGSYDLPVQITLPDGVQLVRQAPDKIRIRIYRAKRSARG
jgi:YbbR domain-containing protein